MAARDTALPLSGVRGRLFEAVTEIPPVTAPYGGRELGEVAEVALRRAEEVDFIRAMEWGLNINAYSKGAVWIFAAAFVSWDQDALASTFPEVVGAGAVSGRASLTMSTNNGGTRVAGRKALDKAKILLFVPDDSEHPAVLLWQAMPLVLAELEMPLRTRESVLIGGLWYGTPDTDRSNDDDIGQWRLPRDLTP